MDSVAPISTSRSSSSSTSASLPRLSSKFFDNPSQSVVDGDEAASSDSEVEDDEEDWKGVIADNLIPPKDSLSLGGCGGASQPLD